MYFEYASVVRLQMQFSCSHRFARCQCNKKHLNRCHYVFANHMANTAECVFVCVLYAVNENVGPRASWIVVCSLSVCICVKYLCKCDIHGKMAIQLSPHFISTKQTVFNICWKEYAVRVTLHLSMSGSLDRSLVRSLKSESDLHSVHLFHDSKWKFIQPHSHTHTRKKQLLIDIIII